MMSLVAHTIFNTMKKETRRYKNMYAIVDRITHKTITTTSNFGWAMNYIMCHLDCYLLKLF